MGGVQKENERFTGGGRLVKYKEAVEERLILWSFILRSLMMKKEFPNRRDQAMVSFLQLRYSAMFWKGLGESYLRQS